ncbi:MAG TPA: glycosyltransferase family 87 protein [Bacteroidia bacterium]|nr:glycosyltransferase family 87 protein [Bacteroidia bacterium]
MKKNLIVIAYILAVCIYLLIEAKGIGDFFIYLSASSDLFHNKNIYTEFYEQWYHYYYSLLFAFLIFPLTYLPFYFAQLIWLALNAFFLYRIIKIIAGYFDVSSFTLRQKQVLFAICFIFGLRLILDNFHVKQITICILYFALEGMRLITSGNKIAGGLCIAFAINIKLLPIVLLPYLIYRKEFKASFYVIAFYALMMILPILVIGPDRYTTLLSSWWNLVNPTINKNILDVDERSFHGLSTLLATLLIKNVPDNLALHIKRNIADISLTQLTWVLNITRLALISFSFYFFRTRPFTPARNKLHGYWEMSYLLLLVPLIFPHQQEYAFLFIMPAVYYIFYYLVANYNTISPLKFRMLIIGYGISYLACNLRLLLGEFNVYYMHFKILTYGALLVIPMLAVCVPKSMRQVVNN